MVCIASFAFFMGFIAFIAFFTVNTRAWVGIAGEPNGRVQSPNARRISEGFKKSQSR